MLNRCLYPKQWEKMSRDFKDSKANVDGIWTCEQCGAKHGDIVNGRRIAIESAHAHHDPWNENPELISLCHSCHMAYDNHPLEQMIRATKEQWRLHLLREKGKR